MAPKKQKSDEENITKESSDPNEMYREIPLKLMEEGMKMQQAWLDLYTGMYKSSVEAQQQLATMSQAMMKGEGKPENFLKFFEQWEKSMQLPFTGSMEDNVDTINKAAKIYIKLYKSWVDMLEMGVKESSEMVKKGMDPEQYGKLSMMWAMKFNDIFGEMFGPAALQPFMELVAPSMGLSESAMGNFSKFMEKWLESYNTLAGMWIEALNIGGAQADKLVEQGAAQEMMKGLFETWGAFYGQYKDKAFKPSTILPEDSIRNFMKAANSYIHLYRSWIGAFEKLSTQGKGMLSSKPGPETVKEFYSTWMDTYKTVFNEMFGMPVFEPMKQFMGPMMGAPGGFMEMYAKLYKDYFSKFTPSEK